MSDLPAAGGRQEPQGNEEFMLEPVPRGARRSWWAMFAIWVGFGYVPTGLIVGGQLAGQASQPGMPFGQALLAIATVEGLLLALTFLLGYAAMRTGLNLSLISRISYGRKGMVLPMLIMACLTLGWFASITGMVGDIFKAALGDVTGVTVVNGLSLEYVLLCLLWGAVFTYSAWRGIAAIEKISSAATPFVLVVAVVVAVMMVGEAGGMGAVLRQAATRSGMTPGTAVTVLIGAWIAGVIMGVDIFRYAKNAAHVLVGAAACFVLTNPLLNVVGYLGAVATGNSDFIAWMVQKGVILTVLGVALWVLALWTTNMSELYCNALYVGPSAESLGARAHCHHRGRSWLRAGGAGLLQPSFRALHHHFGRGLRAAGRPHPGGLLLRAPRRIRHGQPQRHAARALARHPLIQRRSRGGRGVPVQAAAAV